MIGTGLKTGLKVDGSAYFILPESRRAGFELELAKSGLSLKRSRLVFPRETSLLTSFWLNAVRRRAAVR